NNVAGEDLIVVKRHVRSLQTGAGRPRTPGVSAVQHDFCSGFDSGQLHSLGQSDMRQGLASRVELGDGVDQVAQAVGAGGVPPGEFDGNAWSVLDRPVGHVRACMVVRSGVGGGSYAAAGGNGIKPTVDVCGFDELWLMVGAVPQLTAGSSNPGIDDYGSVGE